MPTACNTHALGAGLCGSQLVAPQGASKPHALSALGIIPRSPPPPAVASPAAPAAAIRKRRAKRRARKHAKKVKKHVPKVEEKEEVREGLAHLAIGQAGGRGARVLACHRR